ncbi:MAG TPA: tyrosine-type recombinase/integrase [Gemmataceae bacterium]|nr:tyrosine-type recombinase/integrase [Gemmataceae bacterium]
MPRTKREPWFRSEDNWWYGQIGHGNRRRQERLVEGEKNKKAAIRLYRQLLKEGKADDLSGHSTVRRVFIAFLKKHSKAKCSAETHAWYRHYLKSFAKRYGTTRVGKLKVLDAEDWLRSKKWSDTTKNRAVTCLKVALNWAVKVGILKENPLQNLEKPPMGRRERILTPDERRQLFAGVKGQAFKTFLFALTSTGARPSEIRKVTAKAFVKPGLWVFPPKRHKTGKKTNKPRVVYLTPPMMRLCERLATLYPEGPLFRNSRGQPWTCNAVRCRFRHLRSKFPFLQGVTAYCYRHTFTTDGLVAGVPLMQMQELLGHTSPAMMAHYAHLGQQVAAMQEAAARATRPHPDRPPESQPPKA